MSPSRLELNNELGSEMKRTTSITVVYDNASAREMAIGFCDALVSRFWEQFEFAISWWSVQQLERCDSAMQAAKQAGRADIVVFAIGFAEKVPPSLAQWIELWLQERGEHEGALVSLPSARIPAELGTSTMCFYLRDLAHRAGMDYLTNIPEGLSHLIPESLESCAERAQKVTSLLNEILHCPRPTQPVPLS